MEHLNKPIDADNPLLGKSADQFGYVVPDLEQAIKGWIDQGVGPWFTAGPVVVTDYKYLERPSRPLLIFGFCQVGGVQLELIQPLDDEPSSYRAFLAAGRSGFHHCGFFVEPRDYQRSVAQAKASGAMIQQMMSFSGAHIAYFFLSARVGSPMERIRLGEVAPEKANAVRDSVAGGCEIGELLEFQPRTREMYAKVAQAAVTWDGKATPVRHLLGPVAEAAIGSRLLRTMRFR
jgi:Glyoxalase/Bleomycin resistance protein/Dioxygenase superfamily